MKAIASTAILFLALAGNGSAAQGVASFAMQAGPGAVNLTPDRYEYVEVEQAKEVQKATNQDASAALEGISGNIATGLNTLLDAELERQLQQQER